MRIASPILAIVYCLIFPATVIANEPPSPVPAPTGAPLVLNGLRVLSEDSVRAAIGGRPATDREADRAVRRIVVLYRSRGYTEARAWFRFDPDRTLRIEIDEGRMAAVVFPDSSAREVLDFRAEITLSEDVFHKPTIEAAIARLRRANRKSIKRITYHVVDRQVLVDNGLGTRVPPRELQIRVVHKVRNGFTIDADMNSTYGLIPGAGFWNEDMFLDEDRFHAQVDVGVPYRRLLSEPDPHFQWVYGRLGFQYRFPALFDGVLVPDLEVEGRLSHHARTDVRIASLQMGRWSALADVAIYLWRPLLSLSVGAGGSGTYAFDLDKVATTEGQEVPSMPPERRRERFLARATLGVDFDPDEVLRPARRRWVRAETTLALAQHSNVLLDTRVTLQYLFSLGYHDLHLRARGIYLAGDVLFWDLEPLAGNCMRAFFSDRYWVREAAQSEVALRIALWRDIAKLGAFWDFAFFGDANHTPRKAAFANAVGPSAHFLFMDQFSLDLYYAFGWAPKGFGHNFSLSLHSVF